MKKSCKYVDIEHSWNNSNFCLYRTKKITISMKTNEPGVYFLFLIRIEKTSSKEDKVPLIVRGFDRKKATSVPAIMRNSHEKGDKIQFDFYLRKVQKNFSESSFPMESYRYDGLNYDYVFKLIHTQRFSNEIKVVGESGKFQLKYKPSITKDQNKEEKTEEREEKEEYIKDVKKDLQLLL